ncbi:sulfiredoxin, chloroplastic/mitochondrial isoform X1 [Vitis riparia]|uniref:sulfiredoxin, chloroplastic/mitochondrial isoform X1 n=1 Tax=Vitis riparia TaxID=96939 RepID=UPI00155A27B0|nr:sulfiredoxin, chloroplastic/mitochondrial isoform X1 [Vitis riparia]XP_059593589.1 sulfiredoxin, chloroplastic/mitochondrial isoform X1 [Vitis vinifera]
MGSFVVQFPSKLRNFTVWASPNNGKISTLIHSFIQSHICFTFSSVSMGFLGGFHFSGVPFDSPQSRGPVILELPLDKIRRPLLRTRSNDPEKVKELMESIREIGLQVPIDVLEVDGAYYGFSGCHRYEAHQRLGLPTIRCKVRRGTKETLRHHLR